MTKIFADLPKYCLKCNRGKTFLETDNDLPKLSVLSFSIVQLRLSISNKVYDDDDDGGCCETAKVSR